MGANDVQLKGFQGFRMHDEESPVKNKKGQWGLIVNLDKATNTGTHWVAIFRVKNGSESAASADGAGAYYYDSFGVPPSNELIKRYNIVGYNNVQHQHIKSYSCGLFALKILQLVLNEGMPVKKAFMYFSPNYESLENERLARPGEPVQRLS